MIVVPRLALLVLRNELRALQYDFQVLSVKISCTAFPQINITVLSKFKNLCILNILLLLYESLVKNCLKCNAFIQTYTRTVHPCFAFNVSYFVSTRHGGFDHIGSQKGVTYPRTRKNLYHRCHGLTDNHRIPTRESSLGPLSVNRAWIRYCESGCPTNQRLPCSRYHQRSGICKEKRRGPERCLA